MFGRDDRACAHFYTEIMQQLYPAFRDSEMPIYHPLDLPAGGERPYTILNMIGTLDGKALIDGRVQAVSNPTDQRLMRVLRGQVDAVISGAGTLRANQLNYAILPELVDYRAAYGLTERLWGVVVSRSLDLPLDNRFFRNPAHRPVVVTCRSAPASRRAEIEQHAMIVEAGDDEVDVAEMSQRLRSELGIRRLLSEGGPTLNHPMLGAGVIDEFFLSISPTVEGGSGTLTLVEGPAGFNAANLPAFCVVSVYLESNVLYLRYRNATVD